MFPLLLLFPLRAPATASAAERVALPSALMTDVARVAPDAPSLMPAPGLGVASSTSRMPLGTGRKRPPAEWSVTGLVSEMLIVSLVWSVCSPNSLRERSPEYLMRKKHSGFLGRDSGVRLALGKKRHAYGMMTRRKASKMSCCDVAPSCETRTSFVQQPTARGAQPPRRLAAASASSRICCAAAGVKHGTTCTWWPLSCMCSTYGTVGGSLSRWAVVPLGRLTSSTDGIGGVPPSSDRVGATAGLGDAVVGPLSLLASVCSGKHCWNSWRGSEDLAAGGGVGDCGRLRRGVDEREPWGDTWRDLFDVAEPCCGTAGSGLTPRPR